jgi:hypothetical protein
MLDKQVFRWAMRAGSSSVLSTVKRLPKVLGINPDGTLAANAIDATKDKNG